MPARVGEFRNRAEACIRELQALHAYAVERLGAIPPARRRLATSLDNFQYLAAAYGLKIVRIPGLASGQELRPAVLERMLTGIYQLHVPAVFFEATANPRTLKRISDETGTKTITSLCPEALGPAGSPTGTCLGMLRANIETIARALK
jgi:ABC-type Zn uptake system ZnuABC Zn-binding protein ZnuA